MSTLEESEGRRGKEEDGMGAGVDIPQKHDKQSLIQILGEGTTDGNMPKIATRDTRKGYWNRSRGGKACSKGSRARQTGDKRKRDRLAAQRPRSRFQYAREGQEQQRTSIRNGMLGMK